MARGGLTFCFVPIFFYFFCHEISKLRWPIAAKFCNVIGDVFSFIILVEISEALQLWGKEHSPLEIWEGKSQIFSAFYDNFRF